MNSSLLWKYIKGNTDQIENELVYTWIKQSDENENEFRALRKLYDITVWQNSETAASVKSVKMKKRQYPILLRIAAVFLLLLIPVYFLHKNNINTSTANIPIGMQHINVPAGQSVELVLNDGSKVWLNSRSSLEFPSQFNNKERVVKLSGEGYFDVVHNSDYPFKVEIGDCIIKVLGTEFNARFYEKDGIIETSLLKGSVEVTKKNSSQKLLLKPDEKVLISGDEFKISSFNKEEFLWREGILFIDNKNIYEILPVLEQYFNTKIIIEPTNTKKHRRFTGKFRVQDGVTHILRVLQLQNDFTIKNDSINNTITVK